MRLTPFILAAAVAAAAAPASAANPFVARQVGGTLNNPWAMVFLPDGRALITEKTGAVRILSLTGTLSGPVPGVPAVVYGNQGGLLDIKLSPAFAKDRLVYLSYAEAGTGGRGLTVARAKFTNDQFSGVTVLWRQDPKYSADNHFGGRLALTRGYELYVTAGERGQGSPAQATGNTVGKIVRLGWRGEVGAKNPFIGNPAYKPEIWTLGHRNPYGLAIDPATGVVWSHEMGPKGGDELNVIVKGRNYGWPRVSNGSNYDNSPIPDHAPGDGFEAPKRWWNPSISPAGMIFYTGDMFPQWKGHILMGGLGSQALFFVGVAGTTTTGETKYPMGARIRDVQQGPDGSVYVLTDGASGRLLRITPN